MMEKQFFVEQMTRLRGDVMGKRHLAVPKFMQGSGERDLLGITEIWWKKFWGVITRYGVTDTELIEAVDKRLKHREKGTDPHPFFPTDDELSDLIPRIYKEKHANDKPGVYNGAVRNQYTSHLRMICCSDCQSKGLETVHRADTMCPECYPEMAVIG